MARKKTVWGKPGETGVTKDGIPWYVPERGPGLGERFLEKLLPSSGDADMPPGARLLPARTASEVQERITRKYGRKIADLLEEYRDEGLAGFTQFSLDENVPQPPRIGLEAKAGPNPVKRWWMGGDWNTMAGQLVALLGSSRYRDLNSSGALDRYLVWVRTSQRIIVLRGQIAGNPTTVDITYGFDQVGIRPGWQPEDPAHGDGWRVDIAFADGSWLGTTGFVGNAVPGGCENQADRDLLVELVGPAVTADVLPALGRG